MKKYIEILQNMEESRRNSLVNDFLQNLIKKGKVDCIELKVDPTYYFVDINRINLEEGSYYAFTDFTCKPLHVGQDTFNTEWRIYFRSMLDEEERVLFDKNLEEYADAVKTGILSLDPSSENIEEW